MSDAKLTTSGTLSDRESAELAIAVETLTGNPKYFNTDEKEPRLQRAHQWVRTGKVRDLGHNVYEVAGSKPGTVYTLHGEHCTCDNATKGKSRVCYHAVAVRLYQEWQGRLTPPQATPLCTQPALPSGPRQPDGICAHPITSNLDGMGRCLIHTEQALAAQHPTHEESPMPSPTLEVPPATPLPEPTLPAVVQSQAMSTPLSSAALEQSLAEWSKQRHVITRFQQHFVDGTDYYTIKVGGRETKPTLGKPGAEKFLSLFQLQACFRKDDDTWEMLGRPVGLLCYVCTLFTRTGEAVGEGRGARDIKKDGGDVNKAIKMAQKSAQVDAILRTGALSDAFTQDLDDEQGQPTTTAQRPGTTAREEIVSLCKSLGLTGTSREAYERFVEERTGIQLIPDNYPMIITKLRSVQGEQAA